MMLRILSPTICMPLPLLLAIGISGCANDEHSMSTKTEPDQQIITAVSESQKVTKIQIGNQLFLAADGFYQHTSITNLNTQELGEVTGRLLSGCDDPSSIQYDVAQWRWTAETGHIKWQVNDANVDMTPMISLLKQQCDWVELEVLYDSPMNKASY